MNTRTPLPQTKHREQNCNLPASESLREIKKGGPGPKAGSGPSVFDHAGASGMGASPAHAARNGGAACGDASAFAGDRPAGRLLGMRPGVNWLPVGGFNAHLPKLRPWLQFGTSSVPQPSRAGTERDHDYKRTGKPGSGRRRSKRSSRRRRASGTLSTQSAMGRNESLGT